MDAINISLPNSFRISASMFAVLLLTGSLSLTGCAGAYFVGGATCFGLAPAPVVFSVVPSPLEMNALPVTMEVTGDNFQTWSTVYWDKVPLQTRYVDSSHLEVALKTMGRPLAIIRMSRLKKKIAAIEMMVIFATSQRVQTGN